MKFKRIDVATISVRPPIRSRDVSILCSRVWRRRRKWKERQVHCEEGKTALFLHGSLRENSRSPGSVIKLMERSDRRERSAGNSLSLSLPFPWCDFCLSSSTLQSLISTITDYDSIEDCPLVQAWGSFVRGFIGLIVTFSDILAIRLYRFEVHRVSISHARCISGEVAKHVGVTIAS